MRIPGHALRHAKEQRWTGAAMTTWHCLCGTTYSRGCSWDDAIRMHRAHLRSVLGLPEQNFEVPGYFLEVRNG